MNNMFVFAFDSILKSRSKPCSLKTNCVFASKSTEMPPFSLIINRPSSPSANNCAKIVPSVFSSLHSTSPPKAVFPLSDTEK